MTELCNAPTAVDGAQPCPRARGHVGEHYWWLTWEVGPRNWPAIVYSGEPEERRRRCRGRFLAVPDAGDVYLLLLTISPLKKRELARRTRASEPHGVSRPVKLQRLDSGLVLARA